MKNYIAQLKTSQLVELLSFMQTHPEVDVEIANSCRFSDLTSSRDDRLKRKAVLALAQSREIDVILVTELTRWGEIDARLIPYVE